MMDMDQRVFSSLSGNGALWEGFLPLLVYKRKVKLKNRTENKGEVIVHSRRGETIAAFPNLPKNIFASLIITFHSPQLPVQVKIFTKAIS